MKLSRQLLVSTPAGLFVLLTVGCVSSVPRAPDEEQRVPGPTAPRFSTPTPERFNYAEDWIGHYEGTGSVYTKEVRAWRQNEHLRLIVLSNSENTLRIVGKPAASEEWTFALVDIEVNRSNILDGEQLAPAGAAKYEYSLAKSGDTIAGVIKLRRREDANGPFQPPDEWVFEVHRRPSFELR